MAQWIDPGVSMRSMKDSLRQPSDTHTHTHAHAHAHTHTHTHIYTPTHRDHLEIVYKPSISLCSAHKRLTAYSCRLAGLLTFLEYTYT